MRQSIVAGLVSTLLVVSIRVRFLDIGLGYNNVIQLDAIFSHGLKLQNDSTFYFKL